MSGGRHSRRAGLVILVLLPALVPALAGCAELEEGSSEEVYEPSQVTQIDGSDLKQVTFTSEGADAVGLQTAQAGSSGSHTVVDYVALIYDGQGVTWVYTVPQELTFQRAQVAVDRIEGDQVLLSSGLAPGTEVVTTGATEVYGAELEIAGSH